MTIISGRQVAATVDGIRADHVARYRWAAAALTGAERKIDLGCGCGYGASILAARGGKVTAIDVDPEAIAFAGQHYGAENITFRTGKAETARLPAADAVVAFEVIEHVEDAAALLKRLADVAPVLIGSVPNEVVIPFSKANNPYHVRHFTPTQLQGALEASGWKVAAMMSQKGKRGDDARILPNRKGWTLVFRAERA
jgi:SAM-dependent methyltransferase